MPQKPLISVIIPAYNEEERIAEALNSIKKQTYTKVETIVVANACKDNTAKISKKFADKVIETKTQGISHAKNLGASFAKGDIYVFMDTDSQMKEDLLEKVYLASLKGYTGGKSSIKPLNDNSFSARILYQVSDVKNIFVEPIKFTSSGGGAFIFVCKKLFRKIILKYGEGFKTDLKVMEDVDFLTKLKKHGRYKIIYNSSIYTSMRRYNEEGYWNCIVEDALHFFNPKGKTRQRWNN